MYKHLLPIVAAASLVLSSCKTYYMSVDSFKSQFMHMDSAQMKRVTVTGNIMPIITQNSYLTNTVPIIHCTDKNGHLIDLNNGPSMEIRFTHGKNHKRTTLYLDRIFVNDSMVIGAPSRIIASMRRSIPLDSITKIEVQDGKKNYHYKE